jgi:hypothetical protein
MEWIIFIIVEGIVFSIWGALICDWGNNQDKEAKPFLLPAIQYPPFLKGRSEVKGVYVGECVLRDRHYCDIYEQLTGIHLAEPAYPFPGIAHAHIHIGVICFRHRNHLRTEKLIKHEYAHLLTADEIGAHGPLFCAKLLELGGTLDRFRLLGTNQWSISLLARNKLWDGCLTVFALLVSGPYCRIIELTGSLLKTLKHKGELQ